MIHEIKKTLRELNPTNRQMRWFGMVLAFFLGLAAPVVMHDLISQRLGILLGTTIFVIASLLPWAIKPLWFSLMTLAIPVGWIVSRIILVAFFYIVITPLSFLLRLIGQDPLKLKEHNTPTYWEDFEENKAPDTIGL